MVYKRKESPCQFSSLMHKTKMLESNKNSTGKKRVDIS